MAPRQCGNCHGSGQVLVASKNPKKSKMIVKKCPSCKGRGYIGDA